MGIRVTRDRPNWTLYLDQETYLKKVLQEAQMISESSKPTKMPMNSENYIHLVGSEDEQTDQKLYQKKVGLVIYAAINIRPDIIFAVGKLS